ncbi:MAG TPA: ABC transporter ATP-binding protein [Tepidisphaeraceae bacterium]|jgi:ABC-2 type transport system ATP-binding protein|nr:ABC transporter ATP-binding protein [Tepidisphaeraceae bacterium]
MNPDSGAGQVLLSIESASVTFGPLRAVRDVSLNLRGGNLLGLIGPNGAGKTTLMRAAVGLQPLRSGVVRILDMPLDRDRDVLRHIGFTPDTPPMYDDLTVRQFLQFIGMGYGLSASETGERIDFWLEKVWLTEKANQRIKQLSRGMRQRLGIARTLLPNPSVILLDEPAAGLDPAGRAQFRLLLANLRDQGKALIVSSHILSDMDEYCTHIGIMSAGQMIRLDTVAEVAQSAHGDRCRYTVVMAHPVAQLEAMLGRLPKVSNVQADGERLMLEYEIGREAAASLLAELMKLGLPVASFTANAANLEEAYLRSQIRQVD